jgi:hypothetical protein
VLNRFGKNFCALIDGATTLEGPGGKQLPVVANVRCAALRCAAVTL